jgi:hypothetical protein
VTRTPIGDAIKNLVVKLGGEPDTALFGAFRDEWADDDAPAPEYPARRDRRRLTSALHIGQSGASSRSDGRAV